MSVLIKGMEMQDNCIGCPIHKNNLYCGVTKTKWVKMGVPNNCPLVPVPPHGRLINADARVNVQMYNDEFEDFQTVNMSIDDLLDSSWIELEDDPTIIPASKEGE